MGFTDLFTRVKTLDSEEARRWMAERAPDSYTLLDVREPAEYEAGHLPGALLISMSQLPDRLDELDRSRPVLAY